MQVTLINSMGTDDTVCDAARVSFNREALNFSSEQNERLIKYLAKHNHWSPFAHPQISFRVAAPVPIQTQCFKHKQGLVENGESRRYVDYEPVVYFPDKWRGRPEDKKQGSSDIEVPEADEIYRYSVRVALDAYKKMIEKGVSPEQARFVLPQGTELQWIWTGSLYAFARVYTLRSSPDSQKEIQDIAVEINNLIRPLFPKSWSALVD